MPNPWLSHYDEGVPPSLAPYPSHTLLHYISEPHRSGPIIAAAMFRGTRLTYAELERASDAFAAALAALGVKKGEAVALVLPIVRSFSLQRSGSGNWGGRFSAEPLVHGAGTADSPRRSGVETVVALTRFYAPLCAIQRTTG